VDFLFPPGVTLQPGAALLAVSFDPADSAARSAFATMYNLDASQLQLAGPYLGKLSDSSDRVALEKPQSSGFTNTPPSWVIVDEVIYSDEAPWSDSADGTGASLHRTWTAPSGNDPVNWRAAAPSPGTVESPQSNPDADQDGLPDAWELAHGLNPAASGDAALDPDEDGLTNLQEYLAGTDPQDAASALRLSATISDGAAVLRFPAVAGKSYTVSSCDDLGASEWVLLQEISAGAASGVVEIPDTRPLDGQRFYRVQVQ
jgi:hypothetical protein